MTITTINSKNLPKVEINDTQPGRIIIEIRGHEIDITYDNEGVIVELGHGSVSVDF